MAHRILPGIIRPCGWSPRRAAFSSPDPSIFPFWHREKLFVSFFFLFCLPSNHHRPSPGFFLLSHCILLWSRAPGSNRQNAIFRRIGVSLPLLLPCLSLLPAASRDSALNRFCFCSMHGSFWPFAGFQSDQISNNPREVVYEGYNRMVSLFR